MPRLAISVQYNTLFLVQFSDPNTDHNIHNIIYYGEVNVTSVNSMPRKASRLQLADPALIVKAFRRSAAGIELRIASDLRPLPTLTQTVCFLLTTFVKSYSSLFSLIWKNISFDELHSFENINIF